MMVASLGKNREADDQQAERQADGAAGGSGGKSKADAA
jgi:hypothetical protein